SGASRPLIYGDFATKQLWMHEVCDETGANCKDISTGWGGSSNWTITGSDIYRNSMVRIGAVTAPNDALDVTGAIDATGAYKQNGSVVLNTLGGTGITRVGLTGTSISGASNTAVGNASAFSLTSGTNNTLVGAASGSYITTGQQNVMLGTSTGNAAAGSTLSFSTFVGASAGATVTADENTFIGYQAGESVTSGANNVFVGSQSGPQSTAATGSGNVGVGKDTMYFTTTGYANTAIGYQSMRANVDGANNTALGYGSLDTNTSGSSNAAIGYNALTANTTGNNNAATGNFALRSNVGGNSNSALGTHALSLNAGGGNNSAVGNFALYSNVSGNNNTAIGDNAGYNALGSGNVFLGRYAGYNETGSDKLYIDNSNTVTPLIGGDFSTDAVTINGSLTVTGTANLANNSIQNAEISDSTIDPRKIMNSGRTTASYAANSSYTSNLDSGASLPYVATTNSTPTVYQAIGTCTNYMTATDKCGVVANILVLPNGTNIVMSNQSTYSGGSWCIPTMTIVSNRPNVNCVYTTFSSGGAASLSWHITSQPQ
ncbi:MAG: hypothetical protein JNM93_06625, partial [Bacteriovoracaceae bacterium]|nr:hypothetical protein [Bacteriovoracaceae bacterium]